MRTGPVSGAGAVLLAGLLLLTGCSAGASTAAGPPASSSVPSSPSTPDATPTVTASTPPAAPPSRTPTPSPSHKPKPTPASSPARAATAGRYVFPLRCSGYSYGHSHHDYPATDMFAPRGCLVVAPVSGVVDEVAAVDTWSSTVNSGANRGGLSFSIVGVDGVRYYGSHLESLLSSVRPGAHVVAGQPIGRVGNTGDARGIATHMHFGISWPTGPGVWWVRRGEVYPWPYLDAWRAGSMRSPAAAVAARHRQLGNTGCTIDC